MHSPVAEGLFELGDKGLQLIGTRCCGCDTLYFPQAPGCRNPSCRDKRLERVLLTDRGTLYSYTVQRYQPPPLFRTDAWSPYALGLVDLGLGLRIMGILTDVAIDRIAIGMPVKLALHTLGTDENGNARVTYAFVPVNVGDDA